MKNIFLIYTCLTAALFFMSCKSNNQLSNEEKLLYTKMGNSVVKQTFDTLRNSLQTAIGEFGLEKAVTFCQTNAYPLTNSFASDSIFIRRTSLKYRNPANKPDTTEERILNFYKLMKEKGIENESLGTTVESKEKGVIHFYKPILLQPMCSTCHGGKDDTVKAGLWNTIDSLYPADKAYGYNTGDLRGIWHITFFKKE